MYIWGGNPLNYGGYKKLAIGGGVWGAKLTKLLNFRTFLNWYFICIKFSNFSQMVPFLFLFFSHFAQIGSTVFKATFWISTFWRKKSEIGGLILMGV